MMSTISIPITILRPGATLPVYQSDGAAGMDLAAAVESPVAIPPGGVGLIPCGIAIAVPPGFEAQVRPRSGLAAKFGVTVLNAPGTIDSDYRGEVKVILINHGTEPFEVEPGTRVAQLIVAPVTHVTWQQTDVLPATDRGEGGFGHTGH
jgi:dUTP pyrophosphatase